MTVASYPWVCVPSGILPKERPLTEGADVHDASIATGLANPHARAGRYRPGAASLLS